MPRPPVRIEEPSAAIEPEVIAPAVVAMPAAVEEESLVSAVTAETFPAAAPEPSEREEAVAVQAVQPVVSPEPEPAPAPAPQVAESAAAAPQLKLDWPSDLVQIETDPNRVPSLTPETAEQATPVRQRRPRPAPVATVDEPLVQVETRSKPEAAIGG